MKYQWKILNHEIVFNGYFKIEKYDLQHEKYGGGWTAAFQREIFERGSAVAVLPYDPGRDEVILIEQFRAGGIGTLEPPWMKEIVAGIIEPGETELDVAQREMQEEAGCDIVQMEKIMQIYVSPGGSTEQCSIYCAQVNALGAGGIFGLDEEFEDIKVDVVSFDTARHWLEQGRMQSAATIIALQWLMLNRDRLRREWRNAAG
jgi:ADP-ribose pyrophosphatase